MTFSEHIFRTSDRAAKLRIAPARIMPTLGIRTLKTGGYLLRHVVCVSDLAWEHEYRLYQKEILLYEFRTDNSYKNNESLGPYRQRKFWRTRWQSRLSYRLMKGKATLKIQSKKRNEEKNAKGLCRNKEKCGG